MKRLYYHVLLLAAMLPLSVMAQSVTYNHDESVMNQFTIGETGAGSFTPDWYYDVLHKNYRNGAMMTNKQFFRSQMNLTLYQEVPHAEALDSALTERMRVEAKNIADRTPGLTDIAWQVERGRYNAINCGLQAVRDAYMPQGKRKEQYLAIYKDILLKNTEVCEYILYLRKLKEVKNNSGSAPAPHRANITTICRSAHGRWKVAMAAGGGIGE